MRSVNIKIPFHIHGIYYNYFQSYSMFVLFYAMEGVIVLLHYRNKCLLH